MRCYAMLSLHSFHLLLQSSNAKFPAGLAAPADLKRSRAWRYTGAEASQPEAELKSRGFQSLQRGNEVLEHFICSRQPVRRIVC